LTVSGAEGSARSVDKSIAAYAARNEGFYEPRARRDRQHVEVHQRRHQTACIVSNSGRRPVD
jgi:hypothetical protein